MLSSFFDIHMQLTIGLKKGWDGSRIRSAISLLRLIARASEEHAQEGRGIKRPPEGLRSVSSLMVARIRALCAPEKAASDSLKTRPGDRSLVAMSPA